ncbi:MAG: S8/S53 family peptidase [Vulcanimicrobiota bacterium]
MAFPVTQFNQQAAEQAARNQDNIRLAREHYQRRLGVESGLPERPEAGTLYVTDSFEGGTTPEGRHGENVAASARSTGFDGPLRLRQFASTRSLVYDPRSALHPDRQADEYLHQLGHFAQERYLHVLVPATERIEELNQAGVHHSALNISMGTSVLRLAKEHYQDLICGRADLEGAARAYGLDAQKLNSPDANVRQQEQQRLQQALIERLQETVHKSASIQQAEGDYGRAVERFVASRNSLVVAGGNDGEVLEQMAEESGGRMPRVSPSAWDSPLITSQVVAVGGTASETASQPAAYSRSHRQNQLYATGGVPGSLFEKGSSFAAPRVAALMAELHRRHTALNSREILDEVVRDFTQPRQNTDLPVLNLEATRRFLEQRKG